LKVLQGWNEELEKKCEKVLGNRPVPRMNYRYRFPLFRYSYQDWRGNDGPQRKSSFSKRRYAKPKRSLVHAFEGNPPFLI
jgi:hypothetical protein